MKSEQKMNNKGAGNQDISRLQQGFTLIEVMVTVIIIGILIAVLSGPISKALGGGAYSATSVLAKESIPKGIAYLQTRNNGSCAGVTTAGLTNFGIEPNTGFGDAWTVTAAAASTVNVTIPLTSSGDKATDGADLAADLAAMNNVGAAAYADPNVTVTYNCR